MIRLLMGEEIFLTKKNDGEEECPYCLGRGTKIIDGKARICPECKGYSSRLKITDENQLKYLFNKAEIPEPFWGIVFDKLKIQNDKRIEAKIKNDDLFNIYLDTLDKMYKYIVSGKRFNYSFFITAPQGLGKNSFVYACLCAAINNNWTVAPYLDTSEIKYLLSNGKDITGIVEADICFIKFSTGVANEWDTQAVKAITDKRARKGKPTILISRFPANYLLSFEVNLDRFLLTFDGNDPNWDMFRLRHINAPFPDLKEYSSKYMKYSKYNNSGSNNKSFQKKSRFS